MLGQKREWVGRLEIFDDFFFVLLLIDLPHQNQSKATSSGAMFSFYAFNLCLDTNAAQCFS